MKVWIVYDIDVIEHSDYTICVCSTEEKATEKYNEYLLAIQEYTEDFMSREDVLSWLEEEGNRYIGIEERELL